MVFNLNRASGYGVMPFLPARSNRRVRRVTSRDSRIFEFLYESYRVKVREAGFKIKGMVLAAAPPFRYTLTVHHVKGRANPLPDNLTDHSSICNDGQLCYSTLGQVCRLQRSDPETESTSKVLQTM